MRPKRKLFGGYRIEVRNAQDVLLHEATFYHLDHEDAYERARDHSRRAAGLYPRCQVTVNPIDRGAGK